MSNSESIGHTPRFKPLTGAMAYRSTDHWQPRGWWLDSAIEVHRIGGEILANVNPGAGWIRSPDYLGNLYELPLDYESQQLLQQPAWWGNSFSSTPFAQTAVNQATVACALERHRLAHGQFPDTIDALVPAFLPRLPNDVLRGRPLNYDRTNGVYTLRGDRIADDRRQTARRLDRFGTPPYQMTLKVFETQTHEMTRNGPRLHGLTQQVNTHIAAKSHSEAVSCGSCFSWFLICRFKDESRRGVAKWQAGSAPTS
jgi:hypothetical protein